MIIKIGGVDAAGKATQSKLLLEELFRRGHKAELMSFPDYPSLTGQAILGNLKKDWSVKLPNDDYLRLGTEKAIGVQRHLQALVLQTLMTIDRYQHVEKLWHYKHSKDEVLVLDRYYLSGLIYGSKDGLPMEWLEAIHKGMPEPDLSLYLSIPIEESARRRPERRDRYETDYAFLESVRMAYLDYFLKRADRETNRYVVINGMMTMSEVHARLCPRL